eukprot:759655-Prorocentrum_lima.AAC.1
MHGLGRTCSLSSTLSPSPRPRAAVSRSLTLTKVLVRPLTMSRILRRQMPCATRGARQSSAPT